MVFVILIASLFMTGTIDVRAAELSSKNLSAMTASELRASISTVKDAADYLNKRYPGLIMSFHIWQGKDSGIGKLRSGEEILNDTVQSDGGKGTAGRSDIVTAMAYLLSDNMDIGSIYGFRHSSDGSLDPVMAANYIYEKGQYKIFDPVMGMTGDMASRYGSLLPEATISTLSEFAAKITNDSTLKDEVDSLYCIEDGQGITFTDKNGWTAVTEPAIKPIYANEAKNLTEEQYMEKKYGHIKPENVSQYRLPALMGGLTMTVKEAKALVGKSPEAIKAQIKTAGDMFLYMLAAKILLNDGDDTIEVGGHQWHYNQPASVTLASNKGNCGRMANLANYLLEGDYEEVGFILHSYTGRNGGHVYNYIKHKGKFYIVDFSSFLFNNYDANSQFNIIALDKLEDYGTRWKECYGGLAEIIAHKSPGTHLPNVWEGDYCYYPEGAKFTIIMETPECKVGTLPCKSEVLDWTKPQVTKTAGEAPAKKPIASKPKVTTPAAINNDVKKAADLALIPKSFSEEYKKAITGAEFCALMVQVYEKIKGAEIKGRKPFLDSTDVNVLKMGALGVISGTKFEPDKQLTREQLAVMLANLAKVMGKPLVKKAATYADKKDIASSALVSVGQVQYANLMADITNNKFLPKSSYTVEQSIKTILRCYNKLK